MSHIRGVKVERRIIRPRYFSPQDAIHTGLWAQALPHVRNEFPPFRRIAAEDILRAGLEENLAQCVTCNGVDLPWAHPVLALAVALAGCSASEIVQNLPSPAVAPDLSQPNHRRIVAANNKSIFPNQALLGDVEISGVRLVDHLKGPAWLICLKLDARGRNRRP
jgi:hypothetical protein